MLAYISYPREFEEIASSLDTELKKRNLDTFRDKEDVVGGEVWNVRIAESIKRAGIYVVLYSPEAANPERAFFREINRIQTECKRNINKKLITVIFPPTKPVDLPPFLKSHSILLADTRSDIAAERDGYWINEIVKEVARLKGVEKNRQIIRWRQVSARSALALGVIIIVLLSTSPFKAKILENKADGSDSGPFHDPPDEKPRVDKADEEYKVVLSADERLQLPGPPGELRVWIGNPLIDPRLPSRMAQAERLLPAVGRTAKVTPFAPAFEIDPKESICMEIHPSGSETQFRLIPRETGTFDVGANVLLFSGSDCSGIPVPKSAETLQVTVVVNSDKAFEVRTKQLGEIFWEKLLEFWGLTIALFFALLLFLIRGRLKKWFSFGNDK